MTPEGALLRACLDWLAAEHVFAIRLNSGVQIGSHKGKRWAIHMLPPGTADVLAFPHSGVDDRGAWCERVVPTWLELKAPKGKQSELQKSFQAKVESEGHRYYIVRDTSELEAIFK